MYDCDGIVLISGCAIPNHGTQTYQPHYRASCFTYKQARHAHSLYTRSAQFTLTLTYQVDSCNTIDHTISHHSRAEKTHRPDTHRRDSDLLPLSFQLRKRCHHLTHSCAPQRMPQRDRAAAGIDLGHVQFELLRAVDTLLFL